MIVFWMFLIFSVLSAVSGDENKVKYTAVHFHGEETDDVLPSLKVYERMLWQSTQDFADALGKSIRENPELYFTDDE